jgi:hypothetical protein
VREAAGDIQRGIRLFQEVDEDNSGELDKGELGNVYVCVLNPLLLYHIYVLNPYIWIYIQYGCICIGELDKGELGKLMCRMGMELSEKRLSDLMTQYDVDQVCYVCVCMLVCVCVPYIYTHTLTHIHTHTHTGW